MGSRETPGVPIIRLDAQQPEGLVERVATTQAVDGIAFDRADNLSLTDLEESSIIVWQPGGTVKTFARDERFQWPDSIAVDAQGRLYVTASQIQRMPLFNGGQDLRRRPFQVFRLSR